MSLTAAHSLFSKRWRLFRPLALGTRSEFRTAWLMKCCFRLEAENLFTWEPARVGKHPARCLWAGVWEWGAVLRAKIPRQNPTTAPFYHNHHLLGFPQQQGAHPLPCVAPDHYNFIVTSPKRQA